MCIEMKFNALYMCSRTETHYCSVKKDVCNEEMNKFHINLLTSCIVEILLI